MREENTAMAVMTIAICDEIRKDAQKLYRQLSTLVLMQSSFCIGPERVF